MSKMNRDRLSSQTNPNGLFAEFTSGLTQETFSTQERIILATADIRSFLIEVAGLDPDMAGVATARSMHEALAATGTEIATEEIDDLIRQGCEYSSEYAVDRAIDMINHPHEE